MQFPDRPVPDASRLIEMQKYHSCANEKSSPAQRQKSETIGQKLGGIAGMKMIKNCHKLLVAVCSQLWRVQVLKDSVERKTRLPHSEQSSLCAAAGLQGE